MDHMRSDTSCQQHNLKRSFSVMSRGQGSSTVQHHNLSLPSLDSSSLPSTFRLQSQPRFHGDGLDLRRPVMSVPDQTSQPPSGPISTPDFIDLTADDVDFGTSTAPAYGTHRIRLRDGRVSTPATRPAMRLPHYPDQTMSAQIIDLEEELEEEQRQRQRAGRHQDPNHAPSPEVEFLHSRMRTVPLPSPPPGPPRPASGASSSNDSTTTFTRIIPGPRVLFHGAMTHAGFRTPAGVPMQQMLNALRMDYHAVGFNLAQVDHTDISVTAHPPTVVEPLPPVREGFTRSPREGDELICPSCLDELSVGDDDVKRQVWVVRACGHVYCGECARKENRNPHHRKRTNKTAGATSEKKMFTKCAVDGCDKPVTGAKAMIQLFL